MMVHLDAFKKKQMVDYLFQDNLSVDLEPNVIDDIRNGDLANLFHPEFLLNGKEIIDVSK